MIIITGLYAGILGLIYLLCAINVIKMRYKHEVGLGDNGNEALIKSIRIHGNFSEYVPIGLLLMAFYELNSGSSIILHITGIIFVLSRISHAIGLTKSTGTSTYRKFGVLSTFTLLVVLSLLNIVTFF